MLRYDAGWLLDYYRDEPPAAPGIPYALIGGAGPYTIEREPGLFTLAPVLDLEPRLDHDETVVRLARYAPGTLTVQPCSYSLGAKSNYAMDAPGELRDLLRADYGSKLPPLSDSRLSNGLGTAVVVYDAAGDPYLPRRAARQSVFPGGYHCTASGEAAWREGMCDFDELFTRNICRELEEEAGLTRADLEWIRPVALCREFLRGGKPQFFFAARTMLSETELQARRRAAIAAQIARGRQEILDDVLREFRSELCTIECVANLTLAAARVAEWAR